MSSMSVSVLVYETQVLKPVIRLFYCELVVANTPSLIYYQFWLKFVIIINASALWNSGYLLYSEYFAFTVITVPLNITPIWQLLCFNLLFSEVFHKSTSWHILQILKINNINLGAMIVRQIFFCQNSWPGSVLSPSTISLQFHCGSRVFWRNPKQIQYFWLQ